MVDAGDLKSPSREGVPVRVRPRAPISFYTVLFFYRLMHV